MADARRSVPSVDSLLRAEPVQRAAEIFGRPLVKLTVQRTLEGARKRAADGGPALDPDQIMAAAVGEASRISGGLTPVINATGVILHTNLGRAPMPPPAAEAARRAAMGYSDLEIDRGSGRRGRRTGRAEDLLVALTGAEAALVVNNGAAAVLLSLAAVAKGKRVLVSRGELIEIGGEFRIPDIVRAAGATLVEVGTTNRTRLGDYRAAMTDRVAAILKVHPSNYRVIGFTAATSGADLSTLARKHGVPLIHDVGSGLLRSGHGKPADEPTIAGALDDGADLVLASGDKLLGGPQAGLIVGRDEAVERLRRHPIARAVRADKMQIAALEQVLAITGRGLDAEIPVTRMLREPAGSVHRRAQSLCDALDGDLEHAHVQRCGSTVGGGSMPGTTIDSWGVRVTVPDPTAFAARLRSGSPSVFCRVEDDHVLLDARTIDDEHVADAARAVLYAIEGDEFVDED